jgi:hypothetical protein
VGRIVHLDEHVSRVQSSVLDLLDSPNCNLLLLSDVQVAVLEQMTFPYVRWATRLIEDHEFYQLTVDFPQAYKDELECLELLLSGGSTMTCDLSAVLAALATAIANQPSGAGACNYSGSSAILNCLPGMTPGELIPQVPTEAPEYGVPPPGFDTWAEYLTHKCKAAWAIYDTVYGLFGALATLPILMVTVQVVGTALGGYIAATAFGAAAFPPAAIVAMAALAVAIGLLAGNAYIQFLGIQDYLRAHKDDIICGLYTSGSASEALAGLAAEVEDAVQSIEWAVIFGGVIGPQLAAAIGSLAAEAQTNNLVNPLFQVMEDFAYPDVVCCPNGGPPPDVWHFDADAQGWVFTYMKNDGDVVTGAWDAGTGNPDPGDPSAGQLTCEIQEAAPPLGNVYGIWTFNFPFGQIPEVVAGDAFAADLYCSLWSNSGYTLKINYTDATYSEGVWANPSGWNERSAAAIEGKFVNSLQIIFSLGETTDPHNYAADNVRWRQ